MDEITSPPYPGMATTADVLYRCLKELRDWACKEGSVLEAILAAKFEKAITLPMPDELSTKFHWKNVSVVDKYGVLMATRQIREMWDSVLRDHEASWDGPVCVRCRITITQHVRHILNDAFTSPEVRESNAKKKMSAAMKSMRQSGMMFFGQQPEEEEETLVWPPNGMNEDMTIEDELDELLGGMEDGELDLD